MVNEIALKTLEVPVDTLLDATNIFELCRDINEMQKVLSEVGSISGPSRSLTRFQRSAKKSSISGAAKDSTAGVYDALMALNKAFLETLAGTDYSMQDALKRLAMFWCCLLYTSPSPRDGLLSRMPSSA